jgi:hypothetical protein
MLEAGIAFGELRKAIDLNVRIDALYDGTVLSFLSSISLHSDLEMLGPSLRIIIITTARWVQALDGVGWVRLSIGPTGSTSADLSCLGSRIEEPRVNAPRDGFWDAVARHRLPATQTNPHYTGLIFYQQSDRFTTQPPPFGEIAD